MKTLLNVYLLSSNEKANKDAAILPSNAENTNIHVSAEKLIFSQKQYKHTLPYEYIWTLL